MNYTRLMYVCFAVMVSISLYMPVVITGYATRFTRWFVSDAGALVLVSCTMFLLLSVFMMFSPYRHMRLGGRDARPAYSTISWLAMLFATGMGSGLVFYGAAEPLIHYATPPADAPMHDMPHALALTYFHWGFHAWAIYAVSGLTIAYVCFCRNIHLTPAASVGVAGKLCFVVNGVAIIAILFGVVGSLCMTVLQLADGIMEINHIDEAYKTIIMFATLAVLCVVFITSSCTGLGKGIKILSNVNIAIALLLLAFVCFAAWHVPYGRIISGALVDYAGILATHSLRILPESAVASWQQDWSITLFLWWIAWSPFVGVFIARISYGRTIQAFILGVLCVPTLFTVLWFGIFGAATLSDVSVLGELDILVNQPQHVTYRLLESLPYSHVTHYVMLLLLFIFLVTSADSGAYVLAMFTSDSHYTPTIRARLFWGVVFGVVTGVMLLIDGGIGFIKSIAILGGIPYMFIMLWQVVVMLKDMRINRANLQ
jgi:glycine betaine transporter